jgi:hypothetical protein
MAYIVVGIAVWLIVGIAVALLLGKAMRLAETRERDNRNWRRSHDPLVHTSTHAH